MENFKSKHELFLFIKSSISQDIILTGSTALKIMGLTDKSDECDLDIVIPMPTENTKKQLDLLKLVFPKNVPATDTKPEKPTKKEENDGYDEDSSSLIDGLGETIFLNVSQAEKPIKCHIFLWNSPVEFLTTKVGAETINISKPGDIFWAKKTMGRRKDYQQLAEVCAYIFRP